MLPVELLDRSKSARNRLGDIRDIAEKSSSGHTRQIFVYWHDFPTMPLFEKRCVGSMRECNPGIPIKLINEDRITRKLPKGATFPMVAHKCDWLRLCALYECGGVYMDVSCVCLKSVDTWPRYSDRLCGFSQPWYRWGIYDKFPTLENSMLCAPPGDPFVLLWIEEIEVAAVEGFETYCNKIHEADKGQLADLTLLPKVNDRLIGFLPYLTPYLCFRVAYIKACRTPGVLLPHDMGQSPLFWANINDWHFESSVQTLLGSLRITQDPPVIKLANEMKDAVKNALDMQHGKIIENALDLKHGKIIENALHKKHANISGYENGILRFPTSNPLIKALGYDAVQKIDVVNSTLNTKFSKPIQPPCDSCGGDPLWLVQGIAKARRPQEIATARPLIDEDREEQQQLDALSGHVSHGPCMKERLKTWFMRIQTVTGCLGASCGSKQ